MSVILLIVSVIVAAVDALIAVAVADALIAVAVAVTIIAVASVGTFIAVAIADAVLVAVAIATHVDIIGVAVGVACMEGSVIVWARTIVGQTEALARACAVGVVSEAKIFSSALVIHFRCRVRVDNVQLAYVGTPVCLLAEATEVSAEATEVFAEVRRTREEVICLASVIKDACRSARVPCVES